MVKKVVKKIVKKSDKKSAKTQTTSSHTKNPSLNFGQKAADKFTKWAGSWTFIITFAVILILWMLANTTWIIFRNVWDPHPFILLNLVLSCLAAFQAPIILMSQNRSNERDRQRAEYDYAVNRKAEREIQQIRKAVNRIEKRFLEKK